MIFVAFIKDNTAVAVSQCKSIDELNSFSDIYDSVIEITEDDFKNIALPAKLINGVWTKTDKTPHVDYPESHVSKAPTELEQLRADIDYIAVMTGVDL